MTRIRPADNRRITDEQFTCLCETPRGLFTGLPDDSLTLFGMIHEEIETIESNKPCYMRPDKLPKDALDLGLLTLIPLYQEKINIGWIIQVPDLIYRFGPHYIMVRRRGQTLIQNEQPSTRLFLKSVMALTVADKATMLISTQTKDVRT